VLLLHPSWYEVCQKAIADNPSGGLFTCFTNNIGCKLQLLPDAPKGHDIAEHRARAKAVWEHYGYGASMNRTNLIGGFFMLTSKTAWKKSGGFPEEGFFGVDNEYHRRIMAAGFKCFRMDGLYAYHIRNREGGSWIDGVATSATLARKRTPIEISRSSGPAMVGKPTDAPKRRCVYTVVTGGYDEVQPHASAPGWDFVCFSDSPNIKAPGWKVVLFHGDGLDPRRASRLPKILPHRYLADYQYSLYIDANRRLYRDPTGMAERAGWRGVLCVRHPFRQCVYAELKAIAALGKSSVEAARAEADLYRGEGIPENAGLNECGCMFRRHNDPDVIAMDEAWWKASSAAPTTRDQPAFAVALWRLKKQVSGISAMERSRYMRGIPHKEKSNG